MDLAKSNENLCKKGWKTVFYTHFGWRKRVGKDPKNRRSRMSWGWAETQLLYTHPEAAVLEGLWVLRTFARAPPRTNLHIFWALSPYSTCFWTPWSEDSLVLTPVVVRGQPNSKSYKSYTRVVYLCASRSVPPDFLNLIFQNSVHLVQPRKSEFTTERPQNLSSATW